MGNKMETAINIGFACSLLRKVMKQIIVTLKTQKKFIGGGRKREHISTVTRLVKEGTVKMTLAIKAHVRSDVRCKKVYFILVKFVSVEWIEVQNKVCVFYVSFSLYGYFFDCTTRAGYFRVLTCL